MKARGIFEIIIASIVAAVIEFGIMFFAYGYLTQTQINWFIVFLIAIPFLLVAMFSKIIIEINKEMKEADKKIKEACSGNCKIEF